MKNLCYCNIVQRIRWSSLVRDEAFHLGRTPYRRGAVFPMHDHDFAEVCWLAAGSGRWRHRTAAGECLLEVGDLLVLRPQDAHAVAVAGDGFSLVNLAFPVASLIHLRERYGIDLVARSPEPHHLPAGSLAWLDEAVRRLAHGPRTLVALERFLIDLAGLLAPAEGSPAPPGCPPWLQELVRRLAAGELLEQGVSQLAAAAGCSRGHLARACMAHLGCTATELLNRHRLARASSRLAIDDASITAIAADCGLANLSHFYRLFRTATGMTPRAWRLRARRAG